MCVNSTENIKILTLVEQDLPLLERKLAPLEEAWRQARQEAEDTDFEGYQESCLIGKEKDVIDHWPPQYIVGTPTGDMEVVLAQEIENVVRVSLVKLTCQYAYSNPTGMFNLSITDRKWKPRMGVNTLSYGKWRHRMNQKDAPPT